MRLSKILACNTFPDYFIVDSFPLQAHCLQQFLGELKGHFLPPGDHEDQTEDGIVEIVDVKGLESELVFQILRVVDHVDNAGEDCGFDGEGGREEEEASGGDDCRKLKHESNYYSHPVHDQ